MSAIIIVLGVLQEEWKYSNIKNLIIVGFSHFAGKGMQKYVIQSLYLGPIIFV